MSLAAGGCPHKVTSWDSGGAVAGEWGAQRSQTMPIVPFLPGDCESNEVFVPLVNIRKLEKRYPGSVQHGLEIYPLVIMYTGGKAK